MIWVDRLVQKIKQRNLKKEWVDDMKTPSGRIHVGSLRGVIIHDLVYKVLKENGINVQFSYVFNDFDSMDSIPAYLDYQKWEKYAGMPLCRIPSPISGYPSFASFYAQEFIDVFQKLDCHPKIIWSSELYQTGKMDNVVMKILKNADKIRKIYKEVAKAEKPDNWFPYQPVCQKCGKVGTTNTYRFDGKYVYYRCEPRQVTWAAGCGYEGKVEPKGDNGKLPWKVDWPAHWQVIGITIESSGKDHMSKGGSYDIASHIAKEVLGINPPEAFGGYEWFTVGGKKMSSSKGIGASAKEISTILPPSVFRFFIVRAPIQTHIDFNPSREVLFNIFDDYDRCFNAYFDKVEGKIPPGKKGEVLTDFARIIELSKVFDLPKKRLYLPRFRTIYNLLLQKKDNLTSFFEGLKKDKLNKEEIAILEERIFYAKKLMEREEETTSKNNLNQATNFTLNNNQKKFLKTLKENLEKLETFEKEKIQEVIKNTLNETGISPKEAFQGFYLTLTGKPFGPKAVDLIINLGIKETINNLVKNVK